MHVGYVTVSLSAIILANEQIVHAGDPLIHHKRAYCMCTVLKLKDVLKANLQ